MPKLSLEQATRAWMAELAACAELESEMRPIREKLESLRRRYVVVCERSDAACSQVMALREEMGL